MIKDATEEKEWLGHPHLPPQSCCPKSAYLASPYCALHSPCEVLRRKTMLVALSRRIVAPFAGQQLSPSQLWASTNASKDPSVEP